jgi:hypothetical protein
LAKLVPGSRVWLVVDDTLCHKRGAKVAFGGIFLDAVMSSKNNDPASCWLLLGTADILVKSDAPPLE